MPMLRVRLASGMVAALVAIAALGVGALAADRVPALTRPVHDFANVIDPQSEAALEQLSRSLETATGDAMAVVTVPTVEPYADAREYAVQLFENSGRGIGQRGK